MPVKERMRESILAVAKIVDKDHPRSFVCSNEPKGRDPHERGVIEEMFGRVNQESDQREREFYEGLYAKYDGDPRDLPWNKK